METTIISAMSGMCDPLLILVSITKEAVAFGFHAALSLEGQRYNVMGVFSLESRRLDPRQQLSPAFPSRAARLGIQLTHAQVLKSTVQYCGYNQLCGLKGTSKGLKIRHMR